MLIQALVPPKPIGYRSCVQPSRLVGSDFCEEVNYFPNYSFSGLTVFLCSSLWCLKLLKPFPTAKT